MDKITAVEGLLFIAGDEGIDRDELFQIFENDQESVLASLEVLKEKYNFDKLSALQINTYGSNIKITTKSEHNEFYQKFFSTVTMQQLSNAALEVLAIVAYNQPITRARIEDVRGVNSDGVIRKLQMFQLIEEVGREETVGTPILFGVTNQFLDYFGLLSIEELPVLQNAELADVQEEVDIFMTKYQEQNESFDE